jgi:heme exporter protein A
MNLLEARNLSCIRDDRILFENLNFKLNSGQVLQIEGHNGSGKTSLLRILCGLTLASEGQVFWNNQDIAEEQEEFYADLNYIGHTPGIKLDLTPIENLRVAQALSSKPINIDLEEALNKIGLYGFEDVLSRTLSAGQKRRVALARLLISDYSLWILDEPFTALDKKGVAHVEHILDKHASNGGMAILTSHHHVKCEYINYLQIGK